MARFKKGSLEAKKYMAKIRGKKKSKSPKKLSSVKPKKQRSRKGATKGPRTKKQSLSGIAQGHFAKGIESLLSHYGALSARALNAGTAKVKREINKQIKEVKKKISVLKKLK